MPVILLMGLPFMLAGSVIEGGAESVTVQPLSHEQALGGHLELAEDPSHQWTLEKILAAPSTPGFAVNGNSAPYLGFSESTWWLRVVLHNPSPRPLKRFVEFGFPLLDEVTLYAQRRNNIQPLGTSGFKVPFEARPVAHRNSIFPVEISANETLVLYGRIRTQTQVSLPVTLWSEAGLRDRDQRALPLFGLFFGVLLVMCVYNLILFLSMREVSYLYYVGYVFFMAWWIASLLGLTFQHVWPASPGLNHVTLIAFSFSSATFALVFARRFLRTAQHAPRLDKVMVGLAAVFVVDMILTSLGWIDLRTSNRLASPLALLWIILLLSAGGIAARRGDAAARFFLPSFGVYAIGVVVWTAYRQGAFTPYHHGIYFFQFTLALGAIFLALGLADKINLLNRQMARFVPHEFLDFLGHGSILDVRLGDQVQREMTVLFSDIRSFTTLSEGMSPKENFDFINRYLQQVGPEIRLHRGFIDKYIGDAVMALFPETAEDGVRAAIAMHRSVRAMNADQASVLEEQPAIQIGVGVHTGMLMLGTIGEDNRMEETVISDAVNLAARMEGLTKTFGAAIVVSDQTLAGITHREGIDTRFLGRVQVKGKNQAVGMHEVLQGDSPESMAKKVETLDAFTAGVEHYLGGRLQPALEAFDAVLAVNANDVVAKHYRGLAWTHLENGVDTAWTGVIGLQEK